MYVCFKYYMKFHTIHRFYVYVHILYNILYGIKYMITYQNFCMKVLIMYFHFSIFKLLPSSSPKLYLFHFKNLIGCLLNVNFCHINFVKLYHSHMTLDRSNILVKYEKLCLIPSLKISHHLTS